MVDKRSLRPRKPDSTPTTNGDKPKSTVQNTSASSQVRSQPTRSASDKAKSLPPKKAIHSAAKEMGDDEQVPNGTDPVENGVTPNGTSEDVEMQDDDTSSLAKLKQKPKDKNADEEMTVVVPPSKSSKLSGVSANEVDGDTPMQEPDAITEAEPEPAKVDPVLQAVLDIKGNFALLERAVAQFDARFSLRVLRSISSIRKRLSAEVIAKVVTERYVPSSRFAQTLLAVVDKSNSFEKTPATVEMEIDSENKSSAQSKTPPVILLPEIDIYLSILVQVFLHDQKAWHMGSRFSTALVKRIHNLNRRTLDSLASKAYFYYSLFFEQLAPLPPSSISPIISIRQELLSALRTAVLRKDPDTQATTIVLLLRNYLLTSHISQADLLVKHTEFPPTASNNQVARYLYYLGRIRAIQLSYTEAHEQLVGATRKSPTSPSAAGFYQASTKLLVVVELLMGDIPDRSIFRQPNLERALRPYLLLVQAVRVGDLEAFLSTVQTHIITFRKDGTYTLILRLRQNVIKTGIRMMSLSYSRISLGDICVRLGLESEASAEYIVAKAIRDGVIEATLDHENGFMKSKEIGDVYATREPGEAFHERIQACLGLHDESVKAMRFPMNQHRLELKNAQEARERERELAKEIQDGGLDDEDAGGDFDGI
ncbi:MAG: 26S proteasome non-ATPase regulatory subunit [Vezdaea aestivalis]|nr:MAG: 26S proteasome non-ATPase regulatory subunit [Vezdaea aestivalis]